MGVVIIALIVPIYRDRSQCRTKISHEKLEAYGDRSAAGHVLTSIAVITVRCEAASSPIGGALIQQRIRHAYGRSCTEYEVLCRRSIHSSVTCNVHRCSADPDVLFKG